MKGCLFSLPLLFLSLGCAASYSVTVNGYSASGQAVQIPRAASISVVADGNVPNPILEREVAAKIKKLLAEQGYNTGAEQPDYYLRFDYGIDAGRTVTDVIPVHHPGYYRPYPYSSWRWYGYTTYIPYSEVLHTRWLTLKLMDGKDYRASRSAEPVWIGEVASAGMSSDLREIINYMLIAAFEHFAEDTRRQITEYISRDDERLWLLTEE
ncbi:MAG: hypothetical protein A2Z25_09770 [Planctomycetes bacterium RBG_16_55_9]|nr:MAG: hypothetical protein A2Z25_09770 [Planctomycetes bacterium RBG_16_55_9]